MTIRRASTAWAAAAALAVAGSGCGADVEPQGTTATTGAATATQQSNTTLAARPQDGDSASAAKPDDGYVVPLAFHVRHRAQLRLRPGGRMVATITPKTEFKSPRILAVANTKHPGWVLVRTSLRKHHVGWLPTSSGVLFRQPRSIVIDLSSRKLTVYAHGKPAGVYKVAIGTPETPTPRGRFAVTDRLRVKPGTPYGCCILALTARQPKIAQGWGGGDRVAIHATPATWTLGRRISHGCVRASNATLHKLMRRIRLGAPVTIHA